MGGCSFSFMVCKCWHYHLEHAKLSRLVKEPEGHTRPEIGAQSKTVFCRGIVFAVRVECEASSSQCFSCNDALLSCAKKTRSVSGSNTRRVEVSERIVQEHSFDTRYSLSIVRKRMEHNTPGSPMSFCPVRSARRKRGQKTSGTARLRTARTST